jgi:hypothetical protein
MEKKFLVFLAFLGVSGVFLAAAISISSAPLLLIPKFVLLLLALFSDILAIMTRYYTPFLVPMLKQRSKMVVLSEENAYWLSTAQDSILRKVGEDFVATIYISIPLYRSATEMNDEEKADFAVQISRLVSLSKDPARFTTQLYTMDKDVYIMQLREKINELENDEVKASASGSDPKEMERLRGELSMWRNILESITSMQSLELLTYAGVSATGTKEYEAVSIAQQKATELMSGISSILGVMPSIITGNDLLKFVEPEFLIPYSTVSENLTKGVGGQAE